MLRICSFLRVFLCSNDVQVFMYDLRKRCTSLENRKSALRGFLRARKGQTFNRYSERFELRAVNMYLQGGMSYRAIAKELAIPVKHKFSNHERFQKKLNQCAPVEYRITLAIKDGFFYFLFS
ncbi:hypothetical protein BP422_24440 [Brevibacillus formosus]|uniref:Uncharacterized protein n=1 Tax=Brevibacillus formosus TaxID=54913 RepID=A0A220MNB1_9BACL|nr:hypothetical protein BP422_24440 [Brevibacillus formosus]